MHRAETIMQSLLVIITGLTTTGTNVSRGRAYPVETLPALTLEQGEDVIPEGVQNLAFIDRVLTVRVICHVKTNSQFDTVLNQIREEVYIAIMANRQIGQPTIVKDTAPLGDNDPEISGDAEKNIGQQVMNFAITYRHSLTDPGA